MNPQPLVWCIVGNVYGDRFLRKGAKVVICSVADDLGSWGGVISPDADRPIVSVAMAVARCIRANLDRRGAVPIVEGPCRA